MDFIRELRRSIETGDVIFGTDRTLKGLENDEAKMVIMASNCPDDIYEKVMDKANSSNTPTYIYEGTNVELGENCGEPFSISTIMIRKAGDSNIVSFGEGGTE